MTIGAECEQATLRALKLLGAGNPGEVQLDGLQFDDPKEVELVEALRAVVNQMGASVRRNEAFAKGELSILEDEAQGEGEIGRSFKAVADTFSEAARQADIIAVGDFDEKI